MGGDFAPANVVRGAVEASRHVSVLLVGPRGELERQLAQFDGDRDIAVLDAPEVIAMSDSPAQALRAKRRTSIRVAAEAVERGEASALFSAGHTGATVVAAHHIFGMLPGVERPALAPVIPTLEGQAVLLDAGATADCRPRHLVQFAVMGACMARLDGIERPRIGLLSIGEEETKGNELTREAHRLLKGTTLNFIGNLEARDVFTGQADVIVCDGFTGNVALKVGEGLVEALEVLLRDELASTISTRIGALLSRRALRRFRRRVDYSEHGAAPLVGVNGYCLVGHGRSSAQAVCNGILLAARFVRECYAEKVSRELSSVSMADA
jgi:glycerol-3-phosphate acyltransferase PlsX